MRRKMKEENVPSGYVKIAIENGHRNSGFTHKKWWWSFHSYVKLPEGTVDERNHEPPWTVDGTANWMVEGMFTTDQLAQDFATTHSME